MNKEVDIETKDVPDQPKQTTSGDNQLNKTDLTTKNTQSKHEISGSCFVSFLLDWCAVVIIGTFVASYWRGSWVVLDIYLCNQPHDASLIDGNAFCNTIDVFDPVRVRSAWISYIIGYVLLSIGVVAVWKGVWIVEHVNTWKKAMQRFVIMYVLGAATVNIWRGIWYLTDYLIIPDDLVKSSVTTCLVGIAVCFCLGSGGSLLAPPAIFLLDGPGHLPPPIADTILGTYYVITLPEGEKPPKRHWLVHVVDIIVSFVGLPIFVVWFWRGWWLLMEVYLWGLTAEITDLYASMGYGTILAMAGLFLGSQDVFSLFPKVTKKPLAMMLGRIRTLILALATASFWRVVWYIWDEFLGHFQPWSAWLAHAVGVVGLLLMGCLSCITAPPSTLGVDALVHEEAEEAPLFHDVPVPMESLYFMGIARQPQDLKQVDEEEMGQSVEHLPQKDVVEQPPQQDEEQPPQQDEEQPPQQDDEEQPPQQDDEEKPKQQEGEEKPKQQEDEEQPKQQDEEQPKQAKYSSKSESNVMSQRPTLTKLSSRPEYKSQSMRALFIQDVVVERDELSPMSKRHLMKRGHTERFVRTR